MDVQLQPRAGTRHVAGGSTREGLHGLPKSSVGKRFYATLPAAGRPAGRHENEDRLDYENLDVYRCAMEFLEVALDVVASIPRGESELRSQLKRASTSIPLNIAEGYGKPTAADRARYHAIARGSAMECGAVFDVCTVSKFISAETAKRGKVLIVRLVAMLTRMCR